MAVGMRAAINAMCKDCIYDPTNGGKWREQVEACTSPECPLYNVRPREKTRKSTRSHRDTNDGST